MLELGAGAGLTGLFALQRWSDLVSYTFTDCHPAVLANLQHNLEQNQQGEGGPGVKLVRLDWEQFAESGGAAPACPAPDLVLGADLVCMVSLFNDRCYWTVQVFDPSLLNSLATTVSLLLRKPGARACLASTVRNPETHQVCHGCCEMYCRTVYRF